MYVRGVLSVRVHRGRWESVARGYVSETARTVRGLRDGALRRAANLQARHGCDGSPNRLT